MLTILVLSCNDKRESNFLYKEQFAEYVAKYHGQTLEDGNVYLFAIPVNSCSPCVELLFQKIASMDNPNVMAIAWADSKKDIIPFNTLPNGRSRISLDVEGNYKWYDLGIFVPTVLKYEKGDLVYIQKLSTGNLEDVFKKLGL